MKSLKALSTKACRRCRSIGLGRDPGLVTPREPIVGSSKRRITPIPGSRMCSSARCYLVLGGPFYTAPRRYVRTGFRNQINTIQVGNSTYDQMNIWDSWIQVGRSIRLGRRGQGSGDRDQGTEKDLLPSPLAGEGPG